MIDFTLNQTVWIVPFQAYGTVKAIRVADTGVLYDVRYFLDGDIRADLFYPEELSIRITGKPPF